MITQRDLIDMALELPGVTEGTSWGQAVAMVGKKAMYYWNPSLNMPVFKVEFDERDFLIEADPDTFFTTDHHRHWPLVVARPERLDAGWVRENLKRVWKKQASKTLQKAHAL